MNFVTRNIRFFILLNVQTITKKISDTLTIDEVENGRRLMREQVHSPRVNVLSLRPAFHIVSSLRVKDCFTWIFRDITGTPQSPVSSPLINFSHFQSFQSMFLPGKAWLGRSLPLSHHLIASYLADSTSVPPTWPHRPPPRSYNLLLLNLNGGARMKEEQIQRRGNTPKYQEGNDDEWRDMMKMNGNTEEGTQRDTRRE